MERLKNLKMLLTILFIAAAGWEKDVGYSVADSRGDGIGDRVPEHDAGGEYR